MTLNYSRLGDYIEEYDVINNNREFTNLDDLQGINSDKYFQECKSNKNDIDLFRYRICRKGMFAYNKATSRNGEKISIALRKGADCLVSPSYQCFKIKDEAVLSPDYLMLWFRRPIFDSYARFNSWGSATEFFTWDCFCDTKIYIPSLEEQLKIVELSKTITERIDKLERENNALLSVCKLEMKRFKMQVETSDSTSFIKIRDLVDYNVKNYSKKDNYDVIEYLDTGNITQGKIDDIQRLIVGEDEIPGRCKRKLKSGDIIYSTVRPNLKHYGIIFEPSDNFLVSTGFCVLTPKQSLISNEFIYMYLSDEDTISYLAEIAELSVTTYPSISNDDLLDVTIEVPDKYDFTSINELLHESLFLIHRNNVESRLLSKKQGLLLKQFILD